jgi:uncharacterized protein YraI
MYTNYGDVKVRNGPSTKTKAVKTLKKGVKVTVVKQKNGWSQISSPAKGWIRNDLLTSTKPKSSAKKVSVADYCAELSGLWYEATGGGHLGYGDCVNHPKDWGYDGKRPPKNAFCKNQYWGCM